MAWIFVNIHLEILVIHKEAATLFVDGKVSVVTLREHVQVVSVCKLCFYFNRLPVKMWTTNRMNITEVAILTAFPQPGLHPWTSRL